MNPRLDLPQTQTQSRNQKGEPWVRVLIIRPLCLLSRNTHTQIRMKERKGRGNCLSDKANLIVILASLSFQQSTSIRVHTEEEEGEWVDPDVPSTIFSVQGAIHKWNGRTDGRGWMCVCWYCIFILLYHLRVVNSKKEEKTPTKLAG